MASELRRAVAQSCSNRQLNPSGEGQSAIDNKDGASSNRRFSIGHFLLCFVCLV